MLFLALVIVATLFLLTLGQPVLAAATVALGVWGLKH
jgi:hypothetical protein